MKPGDKVVCVDDGPCRKCGAPVEIQKHLTYVVSDAWVDTSNTLSVGLIGVVPQPCHFSNSILKWGYAENRFRKLDELKAEAGMKKKLEQKAIIKSLFECLRGIE